MSTVLYKLSRTLTSIIYGYKFERILNIVDLASINFSDFANTFSIYSKICD